MKKDDFNFAVKRTQRDYSMSFEIQVVGEIESEELSVKGALRKYGIQSHGTVLNRLRKYGNFDRELQVGFAMEKTPEQKLLELVEANNPELAPG